MGREEEAFELLPISSPAARFSTLTAHLANHYAQRLDLDPNDHDASKRLYVLRSFGPVEAQGVNTRLSACLIVKDEERFLPSCLASIQHVADEIIIVDTGSRDRTKEIASSHGAIVSDFVWTDDFSAARNRALELATGHWILWIDADEELTPSSAEAIKAALVRPVYAGYDIEILNFLDESDEGEQFTHCPTRLFQKLPGVRFTGRIHEQVTPSLKAEGLLWKKLEGATILHHGYRPEVMRDKGKIARTTALLEREVELEPENGFQWFNLANTYLVANRVEECASAGRRAIELLSPDSGIIVNAYSVLLQALNRLGQFREGDDVAKKVKGAGLKCLQLSFETCSLYFSAGMLKEACEEARDMLAYRWVEGSSGDPAIFSHKRNFLYAQILASLNELERAKEQCEIGIGAAPDYLPGRMVYADVLERLDLKCLAREQYTACLENPGSRRAALSGVLRICWEQGEPETAVTVARKSWMADVADVDVWILWRTAAEATKEPAEINECFEAFAAHHQITAAFMVEWGRSATAIGDLQSGLRMFAEAMRMDPSCANAYFNCGDVLYSMGSYQAAVQVYQAGLTQAPEYSEGWFMLGNAFAKADQTEAAVQAFATALERDPAHERAGHNLRLLTAA